MKKIKDLLNENNSELLRDNYSYFKDNIKNIEAEDLYKLISKNILTISDFENNEELLNENLIIKMIEVEFGNESENKTKPSGMFFLSRNVSEKKTISKNKKSLLKLANFSTNIYLTLLVWVNNSELVFLTKENKLNLDILLKIMEYGINFNALLINGGSNFTKDDIKKLIEEMFKYKNSYLKTSYIDVILKLINEDIVIDNEIIDLLDVMLKVVDEKKFWIEKNLRNKIINSKVGNNYKNKIINNLNEIHKKDFSASCDIQILTETGKNFILDKIKKEEDIEFLILNISRDETNSLYKAIKEEFAKNQELKDKVIKIIGDMLFDNNLFQNILGYKFLWKDEKILKDMILCIDKKSLQSYKKGYDADIIIKTVLSINENEVIELGFDNSEDFYYEYINKMVKNSQTSLSLINTIEASGKEVSESFKEKIKNDFDWPLDNSKKHLEKMNSLAQKMISEKIISSKNVALAWEMESLNESEDDIEKNIKKLKDNRYFEIKDGFIKKFIENNLINEYLNYSNGEEVFIRLVDSNNIEDKDTKELIKQLKKTNWFKDNDNKSLILRRFLIKKFENENDFLIFNGMGNYVNAESLNILTNIFEKDFLYSKEAKHVYYDVIKNSESIIKWNNISEIEYLNNLIKGVSSFEDIVAVLNISMNDDILEKIYLEQYKDKIDESFIISLKKLLKDNSLEKDYSKSIINILKLDTQNICINDEEVVELLLESDIFKNDKKTNYAEELLLKESNNLLRDKYFKSLEANGLRILSEKTMYELIDFKKIDDTKYIMEKINLIVSTSYKNKAEKIKSQELPKWINENKDVRKILESLYKTTSLKLILKIDNNSESVIQSILSKYEESLMYKDIEYKQVKKSIRKF